MRYPVYFFLLLTGFFYLTGKPLDDKQAQTPVAGTQSKAPQLKYAAKTSTKSTKNDVVRPAAVATKPVKSAASKKTGATTAETHWLSTAQPAKKRVAIVVDKPAAKSVEVAAAGSHWLTETKPAGKRVPIAMAQGKWRTSSLMAEPETPVSTFGNPQVITQKSLKSKRLDWTVFGNNRARNEMSPPPGMRSQDELDAERIPVEAIEPAYANRLIAKKRNIASSKRARRLAKKRLAAKKRARRARSRKSRTRRYARLKRRNAGAYRVARRAKKRPRKRYRRRSNRKKFGFSTSAGSTTLGGF